MEHFVSVKQSGRMLHICGNPPGERLVQDFWVDPKAVNSIQTWLYNPTTYVCRVVTDDGSFSFLFDSKSEIQPIVDAVEGETR